MTSQTTRSSAHRTALGLVGTVVALALTASSVAAQEPGVDPEQNIEAPQITGVAPLEGQTVSAPAGTGHEATIENLQRAASRGMVPAIFADDVIADIQARHQTDLAARHVDVPAPASTGHEATIENLQRAASRGMIPTIFADDVIADIQARHGLAPEAAAQDAVLADRSSD